MPRRYKPIELPLKSIPEMATSVPVRCPRCECQDASVLGRLSLRLVFRCSNCRARFFRPRQSARDDQSLIGSINRGGWVRVS
jgi:DNA-directed RNA polymerase subunit RPC12/RpoP